MSSSRVGGGAKHRLMTEMLELEKEKWVNIDVSAMRPGFNFGLHLNLFIYSLLTTISFVGA